MTLEESIELTRLRKKLRHERRLSDDEIDRVNEIISGDISAREKFNVELQLYRKSRSAEASASRARRNLGRFEIGDLPGVVDPERRARCRESMVEFGMTYCGHLLNHPPSERMRFFLEREQYAIATGALVHVRWPRGTGKTTWMQIGALWALSYGYRKYLIVIAATLESAKRLTANIISTIETSSVYAQDFPEIVQPIVQLDRKTQVQQYQTYRGVRTNVLYSNKFFRLAAIEGSDASSGRIEAVGGGGVIRGKNDGGIRPDMVFVDDIQKQSTAKSKKIVDALLEYVTKDVLGVFGTDADKVCLMTSTPICANDFSERISNADDYPAWQTYTMKFVITWPERMDLVEEFVRRYSADVANMDVGYTSSRSFYLENKDEIERGAECIDPLAHSDTEFSAFHHALVLLAQMGRDAFYSELQMEPMHAQDLIDIKPRDVCRRVTGVPMCTLPEGTRSCVAFCDVNANAEAGMRWGVLAVGPGRVTSMIAYGRYPKVGRLYPEHTPDAIVDQYVSRAVVAVANIVSRLPLRTVDGAKVKPRSMVFDGGWKTQAVAGAVRRIGSHFGFPVGWAKGFNWRQYRPRVARPEMRGEYCHVSTSDNGEFLAVQTDFWREQAQTSFFAEPLSPGSCSFFGDNPSAHYAFACEVCAEKLTQKFVRPDGMTQWDWAKTGPNHWGDVLSGCFVVASSIGLYDSTEAAVSNAVTREDPTIAVPVVRKARRKFVLRKRR